MSEPEQVRDEPLIVDPRGRPAASGKLVAGQPCPSCNGPGKSVQVRFGAHGPICVACGYKED